MMNELCQEEKLHDYFLQCLKLLEAFVSQDNLQCNSGNEINFSELIGGKIKKIEQTTAISHV